MDDSFQAVFVEESRLLRLELRRGLLTIAAAIVGLHGGPKGEPDQAYEEALRIFEEVKHATGTGAHDTITHA